MMIKQKSRCILVLMSALLGPTAFALSDMESYYQAREQQEAGHYAPAVKTWQRLAKLGHGRSQFYLGLMYEEGKGLPQNDRKAIYWYEKAGAQALPDAWLNLGVLYVRLKHYHRAIAYFKRCLEVGYRPAKDNLAQLTRYLRNRTIRLTHAASLRQSASRTSKVLRSLPLGQTGYEMRHQGAWVQISLAGQPDVGWVPLKQVYGVRLLYEQGVKAHTFGHLKKAFRLWLKLAKNGHSKSQIMLARLYLKGEGVSKNPQQAIFWSEKALSEGLLSDKVRGFTQQTIRLAKRQQAKQPAQQNRRKHETTVD